MKRILVIFLIVLFLPIEGMAYHNEELFFVEEISNTVSLNYDIIRSTIPVGIPIKAKRDQYSGYEFVALNTTHLRSEFQINGSIYYRDYSTDLSHSTYNVIREDFKFHYELYFHNNMMLLKNKTHRRNVETFEIERDTTVIFDDALTLSWLMNKEDSLYLFYFYMKIDPDKEAHEYYHDLLINGISANIEITIKVDSWFKVFYREYLGTWGDTDNYNDDFLVDLVISNLQNPLPYIWVLNFGSVYLMIRKYQSKKAKAEIKRKMEERKRKWTNLLSATALYYDE